MIDMFTGTVTIICFKLEIYNNPHICKIIHLQNHGW